MSSFGIEVVLTRWYRAPIPKAPKPLKPPMTYTLNPKCSERLGSLAVAVGCHAFGPNPQKSPRARAFPRMPVSFGGHGHHAQGLVKFRF